MTKYLIHKKNKSFIEIKNLIVKVVYSNKFLEKFIKNL